MSLTLRDAQFATGAVFEAESSVPFSYGNDPDALEAARTGVALYDRTDWGRLQVADADCLHFLHNQSTNNLNALKPGQGCDTLFVTATARTIELATAYVLEDSVLVMVSPNRREYLLNWLDRYIFFGDKVKLTDETEQTAAFSVIGAESRSFLEQVGIPVDADLPYASHTSVSLAKQEIRLIAGNELALPGYTLIMDSSSAGVIWEALVQQGAMPMGARAWEQLRIQQGRPMPDQELTEEFNAVEACLWQAISLNKGCYIGQETIARLDTYKGVKQQIWGIQLEKRVEPGTPILSGDEKVGILTSVTATEAGAFGLGYVRTKVGGAGLQVQIEGSLAELVEVPFLKRDRPA